jgi:hypothetical protein
MLIRRERGSRRPKCLRFGAAEGGNYSRVQPHHRLAEYQPA